MPPEPGCRGPVTNIPITVLEQLNKHAEEPLRHSSSPAPSIERQSAQDIRSDQERTPSGGHLSPMTVDTQSDVLPWSLTPTPLVDEELPPDSSPEPSVHGRRARTSTRMSSPNEKPNQSAFITFQHTSKRTWKEGQAEYPEYDSQRLKRQRGGQVAERKHPSSSILSNASKSHQIPTVQPDVRLRAPKSGSPIHEPATAAAVQDSPQFIRNHTPASMNFTGAGSFPSSTLDRLGTLSNPSKHDWRSHSEVSDGLHQESLSPSLSMSALKLVEEPRDNSKHHKVSLLELLERYGSRTVPTMTAGLRDLGRSDNDNCSKRRALHKTPSLTAEEAVLDAHSSFNTTSRNSAQRSSTPGSHSLSKIGWSLEHAQGNNLGHLSVSGSSFTENATRLHSLSSLTAPDSSLSKRTLKPNWPEHSTSLEETAIAAATEAVVQQTSAKNATAAADKGEEGEEDHNNENKAWWEDEHTPMKDYVRSYLKLRSVQGQLGSVDDDHEQNPGRIRPIQTQLSILSWEL